MHSSESCPGARTLLGEEVFSKRVSGWCIPVQGQHETAFPAPIQEWQARQPRRLEESPFDRHWRGAECVSDLSRLKLTLVSADKA
jgi:hypothetical protein